MTDKQHKYILFAISIAGMAAAVAQCEIQPATAAVQIAPITKQSITEYIHLALESASMILLLKIVLSVGKFIQWKDDHVEANKREFKGVHKRIDDVSLDLKEVRAKI